MHSDAQRFLDAISVVDYFKRGAMDVEEHCVLLAAAFELDDVLARPTSNAIYDLLTSLAETAAAEHGVLPLERSKFRAGLEYDEYVHPGGQLTLLHPGTAIMLFDAYIHSLGQLVGKQAPESGAKLGYWIDPNWTFVAAFVDRFHQCIGELILLAEQEERQERGYSTLEAMRIALLRPESKPEPLLEAHARTINELVRRIADAIENGAYTEAIALEERVLSTLLGITLQVHGLVVPQSLVDRINKARELDGDLRLGTAPGLWARAHAWRQGRNTAIHGDDPSIFEPPIPMHETDAQTRKTADMGIGLLGDVRAWCIEARARSLDMSLPRPRDNPLAH
jgi:hypothetical protein